MLREGMFDHHRLDAVSAVAAGGTPLAQLSLGPVPQGYVWYIENIAFSVLGNAHTAAVDVAITPDDVVLPAQASWDHAGLVWTLAAAIRGSVQPGLPFYAQAGHFVHLVAAGGTLAAADVVVATFQVAVHQLNPAAFMSPEDRQAVRAAHEHPNSGLVESAVAGRRAV